MTDLRGPAALCAVLLCGGMSPACSVDDRLLSPCGDGGATAADGGSSGGAGGSTSTVDGSAGAPSGGRGGERDGASDDGGPTGDSGGCPGCPADNLVVNADFDSDVGGWAAEPKSTIEWDAEDASGSDASGSIQVHNNHVEDIENQTAVGARQCATAIAGATYELAAKVLIRVTEGSGNGHVNVGFFAGPSCEGPQLPKGGFTTTSAFRLGDWENERGSIVAPEKTGSIAVRLVAQKPLRQETLAVVFDEVRVLRK